MGMKSKLCRECSARLLCLICKPIVAGAAPIDRVCLEPGMAKLRRDIPTKLGLAKYVDGVDFIPGNTGNKAI